MERINRFDVWSPQFRADLHANYARMRAETPVCPIIDQSGNRFWLLTRYEDCVAVLRDHQQFANDHTRYLSPEELERRMPADEPMTYIMRHMLNLDQPDHTRLRTLVHKAFTPRIIEGLHSLIQRTADELIDEIVVNYNGSFDLVDTFAFVLPATVIAGLLGIPSEDRADFRRWTHTALYEYNDADARRRAGTEILAYFSDIMDKRRAEPANDLISGLVAAEEAGDKLDHREMMSMIFLLLVAGHETTVNLIGTGTLNLLRYPQAMRDLITDPTLMKRTVEEMLRFEGSTEATLSRFAATDSVEIRGIKIPQGEMVTPVLLAANRDPDVFDNPDVFDIRRDPNRHIAFGLGIHFCLGAPLARMEIATAMSTLLRRLPNIRLAVPEAELQWVDQGILLHGLKHLPLTFG